MKTDVSMPRMNPKIDLVFKKLFGSEENKDILMSLINAILPENEQITDLRIKNPYNFADYVKGKLSILDIKAEDEKGNLYDIEMQIRGDEFYGRRTLYYWAKLFGSQLDHQTEEEIQKKIKGGKYYSDLNKCIVISLMDFDFFNDERYHRCFMLKDRETNDTHQDLNYLDLYFVELQKFEKKHKAIKTALDRWIRFLNSADLYKSALPSELAEIEAIRKAKERLERLYMNEEEQEIYDGQYKHYLDEVVSLQYAEESRKLAIQRAVEKALQEAEKIKEKALKELEKQKEVQLKKLEKQKQREIKEVEKKKQTDIARKLIDLGLDNTQIAQSTGLSHKEIQKLRKEKN
ncbi:Rpn family recombination-promoting nuclease/putative transposase [Raineya sp.]